MGNGEVFFLLKSILRLIFSNFKNVLVNENYLISDYELLLSKVDTIENKEDLKKFKNEIKNFFDTYFYFFEFNLSDERRNLKEIIINIENLTNDLFYQADIFKNKLKEFQASLNKAQDLKNINDVLVLMNKTVSEVVNFIEFFANELMELKNRIKNASEKIMNFEKKIVDLKKKAFIDDLTKVYNRRGLETKLKFILMEFIPGKSDFAIIFFDLDNFKEINDQYGHHAGDLILKKVAELIKKSVRENDMVCRYGGDEFIVVIFGVSKPIASGIGRRIVDRISKAKFIYNGNEIKVKVSGGLYYVDKREDLEDVIKKADEAMYEAKKQGNTLKIV